MWINWTNNKQGVKVTHTHNLYNYIKILSKTKFVFCHTSYLPLTHLVIVTRSLGSGFKRAQLWSKRRDGPFPKTTRKKKQVNGDINQSLWQCVKTHTSTYPWPHVHHTDPNLQEGAPTHDGSLDEAETGKHVFFDDRCLRLFTGLSDLFIHLVAHIFFRRQGHPINLHYGRIPFTYSW